MPNGVDPKGDLPRWFYLVRGFVCMVVGAILIIHEVFGVGQPPGPLVVVVGLGLMGFAPADLASFLRASSK